MYRCFFTFNLSSIIIKDEVKQVQSVFMINQGQKSSIYDHKKHQAEKLSDTLCLSIDLLLLCLSTEHSVAPTHFSISQHKHKAHKYHSSRCHCRT